MSFPAAVVSVLKKYAKFSGRARRSELWWYLLAYAALQAVVNVAFVASATVEYVDTMSTLSPDDTDGAVSALTTYTSAFVPVWVLTLALLLPTLAVYVRRLHDVDKSGGWIFFALVPVVGPIMLIVWFATAGTVGANRFGPDPKAVSAAAKVPAAV
ncbi:DUF805 domain-containing protein [Xylanimonas protaetiae]|uniref:DUF805 domain-containing protein n=1 Tax=Xylanimonas protaetiae TaxID=2509457 RepID=A0A4P6F581_9MICO|nr:DUF805 domain-containing protein [Xylanimonas protaetiae]QAY69389.1 DUF805 domain-containing protein [Xylanimonas protaetiae]